MFSSKGNATTAELEDHLAIIELISRMVLLLDARDWDGLVPLFTDTVYQDRTSLTGGEPATVPVAEFVGGWRYLMANLDAVHHIVSCHVVNVEGDSATCAANMLGTHVLANATGGSTWRVGGRHDYQLTRTANGWRIAGITFTIQWGEGNQNIVALSIAKNEAG
jgi:SnoaL-like domain